MFQVPELVHEAGAGKEWAARALRQSFAHIPIRQGGTTARGRCYPVRHADTLRERVRRDARFLDQTGGLWVKGALIGKVGSVFASTGTQHGGQETTITSFHTTRLHQGMIVVGVPYSCQALVNMKEITGARPYRATTLTDSDNSRQPSENELTIARFQGKHVAEIACRIVQSKLV